jgi:tetratricopeptide (TPR) repeat protein
MLDRHPSREQLGRYIQDELPLPQRRRIRKHVSICSFCQRREHRLLEEESSQAEVSYEAAIRRAALGAANWLHRFEGESHHARELLAELLRDPGPEPLDRLREASQALALRLLGMLRERCRSSWFQAPAQAIELAELEVVVAERLDEARCGSGVAADSRALAWADLGNSYRILSDFGAAELALKKAVEHQSLSGDLLTESEVLSILASLRRGQTRFEESLALFDRVIGIAREAEDRHQEGRALIAKATAMGDRAMGGRGSFRESIRFLRKGLARIDPSADAELMLAARHNFLLFLAQAGKPREAEQLLKTQRDLYYDPGKESHVAKLCWLEGSIDAALGNLKKAETKYRVVKELLARQPLVLESAFASLELSLILCRQRRNREALTLVEEAIPVFELVEDEPVIAASRLLAFGLRSS